MKMARVFYILLWFCTGLGAQAEDSTPAAVDMSVVRDRINQQRGLIESDFSKQQQACYARFAVSDCLRQTRRERRVILDELRRQEVVLNQRDRQAKAQAELDRISRNVSPER